MSSCSLRAPEVIVGLCFFFFHSKQTDKQIKNVHIKTKNNQAKIHTKIQKLNAHFHYFLGVMNYAIETDFFKEAATLPSTANQTPNKETNQITPLCTSPWPARLYVTFGTVSMPNQTFHSQIHWCRESQGPDFCFSLQLFASEQVQKSTLINTVLSMEGSCSTKSLLNLLGFSAVF